MAYYLVTSAFLKLVTNRAADTGLRSWGAAGGSDALLLGPAAHGGSSGCPPVLRRGASVGWRRLDALTLLSLTADISERAADLDPAILGSLDALHLASALSLAEELEGILTYDERLGVAAGLHGVAVVAPTGE